MCSVRAWTPIFRRLLWRCWCVEPGARRRTLVDLQLTCRIPNGALVEVKVALPLQPEEPAAANRGAEPAVCCQQRRVLCCCVAVMLCCCVAVLRFWFVALLVGFQESGGNSKWSWCGIRRWWSYLLPLLINFPGYHMGSPILFTSFSNRGSSLSGTHIGLCLRNIIAPIRSSRHLFR